VVGELSGTDDFGLRAQQAVAQREADVERPSGRFDGDAPLARGDLPPVRFGALQIRVNALNWCRHGAMVP
jgi:hypothetical protein